MTKLKLERELLGIIKTDFLLKIMAAGYDIEFVKRRYSPDEKAIVRKLVARRKLAPKAA